MNFIKIDATNYECHERHKFHGQNFPSLILEMALKVYRH